MNIRELQIGNWVYYGKKAQFPMQITSIFGYLDGDDGTVYLDFEGNEGDVFEAEVEDITPIPITRELLEKNRWKLYFPHGLDLGACLEKGSLAIIDHKGDWEIKLKLRGAADTSVELARNGFKVHYIHELQNLIRLCGIEWEVKL